MRIALALTAALLFLAPAAHAQAPWETAGKVTDGLFDAQTELVLSGTDAAASDAVRARKVYAGDFESTIAEPDPAAGQAIEDGLQAAATAARDDDAAGLAAARGT